MANSFQILISARDRASPVIGGVTGALNRVPGALGRISSAMDRLGDASVLEHAGRGISGLVGTALDAARNVGMLNGAVGLAMGAGTIAGQAALASYWGQNAMAAENAAQSIGVLPGRLRTLQNAAGLAGLSADSMTGSMRSLAETLQDAAFGRNNEAAAMLNTLGITAKRTADGAWDLEEAYGDLADAIQRQTSPQVRARIARTFGAESLLPMLSKGRAGFTAYIREIERLGSVSEDTQQKSLQLGESLSKLEAAASGVGIVLEGRMNTKWGGAIDGMTELIAKNKEAVATWVEWTVQIVAAAGALSAFAKLAGQTALAGRIGALMTGPVGLAAAGAALTYGLLPEDRRKVTVRPETDEESAERDKQSWWRRLLPDIKVSGVDWSALIPGIFRGAQAAPAAPAAPSGSQPIGIRNNNPGNLRNWPGAASSGGFARFETPEQGLKAAAENLLAYQRKYGINTLSGIANRWAPASDGNDPNAYANNLSRWTGMGANQPLNLRDKDTLAPLLSAIVRMENGRNPYSQQQIDQAAEQAIKVEVTIGGNVPSGTTATASDKVGNPLPARVEYTMPSFTSP